MSGFYTIPIGGLKEGKQGFDFEIRNEFFEQFEESEVKEGTLKVNVEAEKRSSHVDLVIKIEGSVNLSCDRCLGVFSYPVRCENRLLIKFGRIHDESDPEIISLPADEHELDLRQYFYEYILLSFPIQKVHPEDRHGKSSCDPVMLRKLKEHVVNDEEGNDPRWDDLKRLINNN